MALTGERKREYQREWMKRRREEWITKQGGRCAQCGSTDSLEVDHVDPKTKKLNPASIWSRREDVREAELVKCQVLCASCHLKKTKKDNSRPVPHGTKSGYTRGCRCAKCHTALLDYWRKRRRK